MDKLLIITHKIDYMYFLIPSIYAESPDFYVHISSLPSWTKCVILQGKIKCAIERYTIMKEKTFFASLPTDQRQENVHKGRRDGKTT
jgi:hypothetical protein